LFGAANMKKKRFEKRADRLRGYSMRMASTFCRYGCRSRNFSLLARFPW